MRLFINCIISNYFLEIRFSSLEAMNHNWFKSQRELKSEASDLCVKTLNNLRDFTHVEVFKKLVIKGT